MQKSAPTSTLAAKPTPEALPQKSVTERRYGFAAGCEAVAPPRRDGSTCSGLCPWFGLGPLDRKIILGK